MAFRFIYLVSVARIYTRKRKSVQKIWWFVGFAVNLQYQIKGQYVECDTFDTSHVMINRHTRCRKQETY